MPGLDPGIHRSSREAFFEEDGLPGQAGSIHLRGGDIGKAVGPATTMARYFPFCVAFSIRRASTFQ
jgi:hypothetical protein